MAIMEYVEEAFHDRLKLKPSDTVKRAQVRVICELIIFGVHPYQSVAFNIGLDELKGDGSANDWAREFLRSKLVALEKILVKTSGKYCVGDQVSLADCCLLPQWYSCSSRFNMDLTAFPSFVRITDSLREIPDFASGHPEKQPDYPGEKKLISKNTAYAK
jgi:maleylacetoacetate isomerase